VGARGASLAPASVRRIASSLSAAQGTPVAPLAIELGRALVAA
jgi:translocation and assembly module TamB